MSSMKIRATARVKPSKDRQAEEMVADPVAYFSKVREQAKREARGSTTHGSNHPKTA
jgi:hypothetical protein